MNVICRVKIYEVDGEQQYKNDEPMLEVISTGGDYIYLDAGCQKVLVRGDELIAAVTNALNIPRHL